MGVVGAGGGDWWGGGRGGREEAAEAARVLRVLLLRGDMLGREGGWRGWAVPMHGRGGWWGWAAAAMLQAVPRCLVPSHLTPPPPVPHTACLYWRAGLCAGLCGSRE